jgi:predicted Zn-dependent peptidase
MKGLDSMSTPRGIAAALAITVALATWPAGALSAAPNAKSLPSGESVLSDGLTVAIRRATTSPTAALEVWIVAPSDSYGPSKPGIARLTALSIIATKVAGQSLRDIVRADGGQLMVSVFPSSTEIAVLAPANAASQLADALLMRVLHPTVDAAGFREAKLRLAEQQSVALSAADVLLRDGIFGQLFSTGPFHASTYGGTDTLHLLSQTDVETFAGQAYVPANEIVVAVGGDLDEAALTKRVADAAPVAAAATAMPASSRGAQTQAPVPSGFADTSGVGLGWIGPSVSDERTSTAMDFISDYLTRPDYGLVAKAIHSADPTAEFGGQFITLKDAGVFYVTVVGGKLSPDAAVAAVRAAVKPLLDGPLPQPEFSRALVAFRTHTLIDTQTPQQLADNYGWYFAQGAPAYAPAVTDLHLTGDYYGQVAGLTAQAVHDAAKTYLGATPVIATVAPRPQTPTTTSMRPSRVTTRGEK